MKKQTLFDLASMPKMVLVITLVVMLGTLFGATSYLLKIPKTDLPTVNHVVEDQCEIDTDCELVYVGSDVCPPCDTLSEEYQCLNKNEAKKARDKWDDRFNTDLYIVCSPCEVEFDRYVCECENGKCEKVKEELVEEVSITTDKMEYEQGENVKITVKNNLDNPIKHLKGAGCGLQGFSNGEWISASSKSCMWEGESKLKSNLEYNFNWTSSGWGLEKYRIAFHYQEQKLIETREIGKIICEKNIPNELENLLIKENWERNNEILYGECNPCEACGCSCTMKNVWTIGDVAIDVTDVSCGGSSYTIKHKDKEYICVPENYKPSFGYLSPPENWSIVYSNEFTIKEKSALDARCGEKVKKDEICSASFGIGYEFNLETKKCIQKGVSGCSVESPFKTLEECQEVCEENREVIFLDKNELVKCNNNNDCVLVNSGCCGCSMGGGMTCINKKYLENWSQKLKLDCKDNVACLAVYLCGSNPTGCECVNNVCQGTGGLMKP